jgi:hypothetical protein
MKFNIDGHDYSKMDPEEFNEIFATPIIIAVKTSDYDALMFIRGLRKDLKEQACASIEIALESQSNMITESVFHESFSDIIKLYREISKDIDYNPII